MRHRKFGIAFFMCALVCSLAGAARADVVTTIRFTELPNNTPVNGVSLSGVTFGFAVNGAASADASVRSIGPRNQTYVQCPCINGDAAGVLTFDFAAPTSVLSFGVARVTDLNLSPGATVRLFDQASALIGTYAINLVRTPSFNFPEGLFSYTGAGVSRAVVTFDNPPAALLFAVDNLTFATPVPEPATLALLGTGLAGIAGIRRRRKKS